MLRPNLLLAALWSASAVQAKVPFDRRPASALRASLTVPRGGDLGNVLEAERLAKVFSAAATCDAVCGALAPRTSMSWFGIDIEPNSLPEHYLHGVGASAATTAVATYLSVSKTTSVEQAIAYGFIARLISMTVMILTNQYHEHGMKMSTFGTTWAVLGATTYALFTGNWQSMTLAKIVSLLLVFHGGFLYLKPEKFIQRADTVFDRDSLTSKMASIDGGYMMMSGLVTGLLACELDPIKTTGFAALSFIPVLYQLLDAVQVDRFFGVDTGVWMMLLLAFLATIVVGTL